MDRNEAHRKFADRPAPYGTYIDAGEAEPIDIIERVVEGLPPDKAYSLGQVLGYCPRAGKKDDTDVELRDSARRVYANNVERGRYEPY